MMKESTYTHLRLTLGVLQKELEVFDQALATLKAQRNAIARKVNIIEQQLRRGGYKPRRTVLHITVEEEK